MLVVVSLCSIPKLTQALSKEYPSSSRAHETKKKDDKITIAINKNLFMLFLL
jgi:hypothetical protein